MHHHLESFLLLLAAGAAVAIAAKRASIPYNVALVVVGLVAVVLDVLPRTRLSPDVVLLVFLPILVFEGALFADADGMRQAKGPILALAIPGVAVSLLATAGLVTGMLGVPFAVALLLGALLAITDTVSVLLAFRSVRVPHRLAAIMEGESLFNDGTALVLISLATGVVATGQLSAAATARALVVAIVGGIVVGGALGAIGTLVLRRAPDRLTAILASLVLVFGSSVIAERLHASPVIAVVVAGLAVGRAARRHLEASRVLALHGFWETAGFCLNVALFLLVGMQLDARQLLAEAGAIGVALAALHLGRAAAVYLSFGALRLLGRDRTPRRWQHVMVVGNIKGALSMAAVLALPADLPYRDRLVTIVFGVTFVTLITQALPFRRILAALRVSLGPADAQLDGAKATLIAARRGQLDLDELLAAGLVSRKEHAERRAAYQLSVVGAERALRGPASEAAVDRMVDTLLLDGQRAALLDAARRGLVSPQIADERLEELDRRLLAASLHEGGA